jgi:hypothetical protein
MKGFFGAPKPETAQHAVARHDAPFMERGAACRMTVKEREWQWSENFTGQTL